MDKQGEKKAKNVKGGVFHRQDWSQFNPLAKRNSFCKTNICEKHPLIGENCIQSLKNMDFAHFHSFYKGSLRQKSLKQKVKVIFSSKVVKKLEILNVTPPIETLPQCNGGKQTKLAPFIEYIVHLNISLVLGVTGRLTNQRGAEDCTNRLENK